MFIYNYVQNIINLSRDQTLPTCILFNLNSYSPVLVELKDKIVLGINIGRINGVVSTFQLLSVIVIKVKT